jgi:hypothetical protein
MVLMVVIMLVVYRAGSTILVWSILAFVITIAATAIVVFQKIHQSICDTE